VEIRSVVVGGNEKRNVKNVRKKNGNPAAGSVAITREGPGTDWYVARRERSGQHKHARLTKTEQRRNPGESYAGNEWVILHKQEKVGVILENSHRL